jgi:hypothetical protein
VKGNNGYWYCMRRFATALPIITVLVVLAACIVVPYRPAAEVATTTAIVLDPAAIVVTAGPRALLEEVAKRLRRQDEQFTIVSAAEFADVAFLDEDVHLARLLDPSVCARVRQQLDVRYVVLVGEIEEQTLEERGFMAVYMGFFGASKAKERTALAATIIDVERAQPLQNVSSNAEGLGLGVGVFYGLFVVPMTESSAKAGLVRGVAASIRQAAGAGPLNIAVMAAEKDQAATVEAVSSPLPPAESGEISPLLPPAESGQ